MDKVAVVLLVALNILQERHWCGGMVVRSTTGSGGSLDGDPAPGRSPGPPQLDDPDPSTLVSTSQTLDYECSLAGEMMTVESADFNVSTDHPFFRTDVLVPRVVYQVVLETLERNVEFTIASNIDGYSSGKFMGSKSPAKRCEPNTYHGFFGNYNKYIVNWTMPEMDNFEISTINITFTVNYKIIDTSKIYDFKRNFLINPDCQLSLRLVESLITSDDLPNVDCQLWFPGHNSRHGLVIDMVRLNVPCERGYLHFSGLNSSQRQHYRSHKQVNLCGKLEELPESDRHIYFPSSHITPFLHVHRRPVFAFSYHLVDYCYNITFVARNDSFELKPSGDLDCTFKIYLPYGNLVGLTLHIGDSTSTGVPETFDVLQETRKWEKCDGLLAELLDGENVWTHCTRAGDAERQIETVSRGNKVILKVSLRSASGGELGMRMTYRAEPVSEVVGPCHFGWIAVGQFCVTAVEAAKLPWAQAEMECARKGGHLTSIRNEEQQNAIDNLLLNSPGYKDNNAYWIGASDKTHEGDFHWSDGSSFSYTNWFPGWTQHGDYNKQPNDDGLSEQDCVEMRRIYSLPSSAPNLASNFMWNDRDCATPNYFVCERLQNDEPLEESWPPDCNRTVILSRQQPKVTVTSPGFPRQYPDNSACDTDITAPPGFRIILDFEELVLENEPNPRPLKLFISETDTRLFQLASTNNKCEYDYLEIIENPLIVNNQNATVATTANLTGNNGNNGRKLCGDWSSKLKLLRYVSKGSKLKLKFSSDYSHHYGGYKARISMENAMQCSDDRLIMFNNSCYLFESGPYVTWPTAQEICKGLNAQLTSILSPDEDKFITTHIRNMPDYRTSVKYWLGAQTDDSGEYAWSDRSRMSYARWLPGHDPTRDVTNAITDSPMCLATQYMPSPTPMLPSGLYWIAERCDTKGGYICKRQNQLSGLGANFNKTFNGSEGQLVTPNHPGNYYNNLDFAVHIIGPERSRIVVAFERIDLEAQIECLYDYVELRSNNQNDSIKWCGRHETDMERFNFVSVQNEVILNFHSDYSITGSGFSLRWRTVDVSGCPMQTLTAKEGTLTSPNYPHFLLNHLNCAINILAPVGKRIWLEFDDYNLGDSALELKLSKSSTFFRSYQLEGLLTEGTYVSESEFLQLKLTTSSAPRGIGFKATYKIISDTFVEKVNAITNDTSGQLLHLNYPNAPTINVDFYQRFVAPLGHVVLIELYHLRVAERDCGDESQVLVYDNYSDTNGTRWVLCKDDDDDPLVPKFPIAITSFMNTLNLRQRNGPKGLRLNGTLKVQFDTKYREKILKYRNNRVEYCAPNPCQHGGKCLTKVDRNYCKCQGHYTGLFCALTQCDLEPCVFGKCELTEIGYKCHCKTGYVGPTCEQKRKPCEANPCESRGVCMEKGDGFQCRCHAWWEGVRCERRMSHIPYKPLSERMLHEPFWLGLMTVFIVMGIIGIVWCAKRHFPEKIEKLLAEDEDRNRSTISSLRSASVREQLAASGASAVTVTPSPGPGAPRSLFGRLGIRKPSILSLTSPHASGYAPATARTFSLDDLLKPLPRRTPSPKKKRNNSTPTKKNAAEKKQILQQLIAPTKQSQQKVHLGELMQMRESKSKASDVGCSKEDVKETKFIDRDNVMASTSAQLTLTDPKLEKKVTFARLLSKVSAEMSSGSEIELGIMQANRLSCAFARPASTPPSPGTAVRSPNSTSSNQGSDSLTSSDLALPSILSSSVSDLVDTKKHATKLNVRQKPSSADSILAMFRNFSSSSAGVNLASSLRVSPSTTPTASSPQDDVAGDDDSTTSSIHTPVSISSGPPESPIIHRPHSTIEVPVLDPLSAHKNSGSSNFLHPPTILLEIPSTINKCLSPIRELPTPLPSPMPTPAMTPVLRRSVLSSSAEDTFSEDRISIELPNISISLNDDPDEDDMHCIPDIAIDPQAEDGLIQEEAAAMQSGSSVPFLRIKNRPPPLGSCNLSMSAIPACNVPTPSLSIPENSLSIPANNFCIPIINEPSGDVATTSSPAPLIIPTLTIQTPSPTHHRAPALMLPGSPPPHRAHRDESFQFPSKQSRRMLKEFDKPTSLDLPAVPPMITVTYNMSEAESDIESISPVTKTSGHLGVPSAGMTYLSPFSIVTRGDHTASESNLSSSGYSSMASPGPSRCGSSNPLCPSEMEDPGPPGPGSTNLHAMRRSTAPVIRTANMGSCSEDKAEDQERRGRSDSETLSDDLLLESNDEGIGTDHIDEKIEDGEVKSAKELKAYIGRENESKCFPPKIGSKSLDDFERLLPPTSSNTLQLPSIVVQCDSIPLEKYLSPVSSRSESPLSDRTTGMGRFSPQFYGKSKDFLPFTDSDGLYDFPSSEKMNIASTAQLHRKSTGRKREKKVRLSKSPSPTKAASNCHLDIPTKDCYYRVNAPRKLSPKRRSRSQKVVSSSSSSDSIVSAQEAKVSSSSPSPETIRWSASMEWPLAHEKTHRSPEASGEETGDDINNVMLPKPDILSKQSKISKLRAISHQIRFLRRLEVSLKRRERVASPVESLDSDDGEDSPRATSPLLQKKDELLRKSFSSSKLQSNASQSNFKNRRGKYKKDESLLSPEDRAWKKVVMLSTTGHSE